LGFSLARDPDGGGGGVGEEHTVGGGGRSGLIGAGTRDDDVGSLFIGVLVVLIDEHIVLRELDNGLDLQ
jgi:hypothetical protein